MERIFDIAIIGGGINGCGIARDAAGRGLSVYLCEQSDLASGTSSAATKLIHGGLRYLEHYEFRLVREALMEREILWRIAPHIIWPLRFVLPHSKGLRPAWLLRFGLFLYDHLGGRKLLPATRALDLSKDVTGRPLHPGAYKLGFEYSDCWVEDARLVALNARDAADRGAVIETRTRAVSASRGDDAWSLTTENVLTGERVTRSARVLINAAGPWVSDVLARTIGDTSPASARLVQGSHIVVRRLYEHDRCYIFQNADNRIIFAIPYETDFTLIGTTDRDYFGNPADVKASAEEISYLCAAANEYFSTQLSPADVIWDYSGVRPLYDDGKADAQSATRDYVLELDDSGRAPLLSVFGGKITTYRRLALQALQMLGKVLPTAANTGWTGDAPLPGGDFPMTGFVAQCDRLLKAHPWLSQALARRLVRAYGTRADRIIGDARAFSDLGRDFGAGLTEAEVRYLMREEWAVTAADIVWRRSKLGLRMKSDEIAALDDFMGRR
ncbi:MAG: glycerol-3-phosphate dehydrogenase [Ancalomicrobiaceae bacterium]|nr:glycerol-3-phosphate dehydrogenase [Ancalomicrobiaceae bacterium]